MPQTEKWEELIRSDFLPYNVCVPMHSIEYSNNYLGGPKYEKLYLYNKEGIARYYENFHDHNTVGEYCLKRFLDEPGRLDAYEHDWNSEFVAFSELCREIRQTDLAKLDRGRLSDLLDRLYKVSIHWHGTAYNVDAIDVVLNPLIEEAIRATFPDAKKSEIADCYNKLTFPDVLSYANRMSLEKLKLFQAVIQGSPSSEQAMEHFIEEYYWVNFKWGESEEYSLQDIKQDLSKTNLTQVRQSLQADETRYRKAWEEKKAVIRQIATHEPRIQDYMRIFDVYAVWHDLRKEGQVKAVYYIRRIYEAIARLEGLEPGHIFYYWPEEVVATIRSGQAWDLDLARRRMQEWFVIYHADGRMEEFFGAEAEDQRRQKVEAEFAGQQQQELTGTPAAQGRVFGPAKVCLSAEEAMRKIQEGDILVTGMTMPEFVPAMKVAAAVVTDEGGLTCHAAIISRELGKPCVVGTKMATRLIKDGDQLEVNANHGVVKLIAKN